MSRARRAGASRIATWSSPRRGELVGLTAVIGAFLFANIWALTLRAPLGHDESVYALRARDLVDGWSAVSPGYWVDYRAPGLPLLMNWLGGLIGIHVTTSRLLVTALGVVVLVATWAIARILGTALGGIVAAALLVASVGFTYSSSTLLADVPGAAFGLLAVLVYVYETQRNVVRWSLLLVPVLTAAATLARFGAPLLVGAGLLAAFALMAPSMVARRDWRLLGRSMLLGVVTLGVVGWLLLTDLLSINGLTPAEANRQLQSSKGLTPASGFDDLAQVINPWSDAPFPFWSKVTAVLFLAGLALAVVGLSRQRLPWRPVGFGLVAGLISLVAIAATVGLVVANYLVLSIPFWAIAAGSGWAWILGFATGQARSYGYVVAGVVSVALVAALVSVAEETRGVHRGLTVAYGSLRSVSVSAGDLLGDRCLVVTSSTPQVGYYSGCSVVRFSQWEASVPVDDALTAAVAAGLDRSAESVPASSIAVMVQEQGKRQPAADLFVAGQNVGPEIAVAGAPGQGRQYVRLHIVDQRLLEGGNP